MELRTWLPSLWTRDEKREAVAHIFILLLTGRAARSCKHEWIYNEWRDGHPQPVYAMVCR